MSKNTINLAGWLQVEHGLLEAFVNWWLRGHQGLLVDRGMPATSFPLNLPPKEFEKKYRAWRKYMRSAKAKP